MIVLDGLKIFFGTIFILFLPGFAWSFIFFAKREINWVERIAISFGLSIAIVTLTVFWLNWIFDVRITLLNTCLIVCVLTIVPMLYLPVRRPSLRKEMMRRIEDLPKVIRGALRRGKY